MKTEFFGNTRLDNPSAGTCDEYGLTGLKRFDDLLDARQRLMLEHPGCTIVMSLDDLDQARYTSGHARLGLGLDRPDATELAHLPACCFEHGEYVGYTSCKAEFPMCLRNLRQHVGATTFADACAHGLTLDDEALQGWVQAQRAPLAVVEQPLIALVVPVLNSADALVAFPNGYFESDLDPAMNHAVVSRLQGLGYGLYGVGATYLGLLRDAPADAATATAVAQAFAALYNVEAARRDALVRVVICAVSGQRHLWLRYVE